MTKLFLFVLLLSVVAFVGARKKHNKRYKSCSCCCSCSPGCFSKKEDQDVRESIREAYGKVAEEGGSVCCDDSSCCSGGCCGGGADLSKYLGYSEEELTSRPFTDFVHPDDRAMVMAQHIKRLKKEEIPEPYQLRIISKDGKTTWLENSGVLFTWEDQLATLNFLTDITKRKRAEGALHKSENQKKAICFSSKCGF